MTGSVDRWAEDLGRWAIPEELLAAAPESPWGFPVDVFARAADEALERRTPTTDAAAATLPEGGTVLDVGCGAGAASLPLAAQAGLLVGLDEGEDLLRAFRERAERLGADHHTIQGRWPDVADGTPIVDVVVSRNVAYNVPDLDRFVTAMTRHARRRAVLEATDEHPLTWLNPYWEVIHGLDRPTRPTASDIAAIVTSTGPTVHVERWTDRFGLASAGEDAIVTFIQRHLCLTDDRRDEVRTVLRRIGLPEDREVVTLWWEGAGSATAGT